MLREAVDAEENSRREPWWWYFLEPSETVAERLRGAAPGGPAMKALAGVIVCVASLAAQEPRFRTTVEAVRVDALVLDGDRPVGGLGARDFELRDSGVVQQIDAIGLEDEPLRIMLALDTSFSVHGEPLEHLRDAAGGVIQLMRPGDRAAVLTFRSEVDLASDWTADALQLRKALDACVRRRLHGPPRRGVRGAHDQGLPSRAGP